MSGLLGQILGGVLGGSQSGQPSAINGILQQVFAASSDGKGGGVAALISQFQSAGLGQHVQSWVGTGTNEPISADQVGQVFPADKIEAWANQAGTTPDAMRQVLAQAIPHVVDHATPGGQVPAQMPDLAGLLGKLLGGQGAPR